MIQTNKDLNIERLKHKYFKHFKIGQRLHVVDFNKDKSYLGYLHNKTNELLTISLDLGYNICVSFQDLHCERFGINICLR